MKKLGWGEDIILILCPQSSVPSLDDEATIKEQEVSSLTGTFPVFAPKGCYC